MLTLPAVSLSRQYTVLESSTDSVFLHVTTSSKEGDEFGSIFKVRPLFRYKRLLGRTADLAPLPLAQSNSNGTVRATGLASLGWGRPLTARLLPSLFIQYYGVSIDHVNRNGRGYVDFEKMIGLDGVAVVNVVSNPDEAAVNGRKKLQTRITHNDGGSWKPMTPPARDSLGQSYGCTSTVRPVTFVHRRAAPGR